MKYPGLIVIIVIIFLAAAGLNAADIEYVSSFLWNQVNDITVINDTAYCAFNNGLVIFDFTDPAHPEEISRTYLEGETARFTIAGRYAYVAGVGVGMQIVDIINPAEPQLIYTLTETSAINDIEVVNDLAYILNSSGGMIIYHVSNPYDPAFINRPGIFGQDILIVDDLMYVAGAASGLGIYSLADPQAPELIGSIDIEFSCENVAVQGNYAYIGTFSSGLSVYDISDPGSPIYCSGIPGSIRDISVSGNIACAAAYGPEMNILDISDPYRITQIASYPGDNICDAVDFVDNIAYLANNWAGVEAVDLSVPSEPNRLGITETPSPTITFKVVDNILYTGQLSIIDITDKQNPQILSHLDIPIEYTELDTDGEHVLLGGYDGMLYIVDVSNPAEPTIVSIYNIGSHIQAIDIQGALAYVAAYEMGMQILDISDPEHPSYVSAFTIGDEHISDIYIQGGYAYLVMQNLGLVIVDISDPAIPEFVSNLFLSVYCHYVYVLDNYACLTASNAYYIIDVSDILHPQQITAWGAQGSGQDICSDGHYVYMANTDLWIIDISDLPNCYEVDRYITPGRSNQIYVDSSYIYVADRSSFMIFRLNPTGIDDDNFGLPASFALRQNYPNPFNARTEIKFNLKTESRIQLTVYDILGRKIETLLDSHRPAGSYNIIWDARDLPSGVYFYNLQAGDLTDSKKCLLLK